VCPTWAQPSVRPRHTAVVHTTRLRELDGPQRDSARCPNRVGEEPGAPGGAAEPGLRSPPSWAALAARPPVSEARRSVACSCRPVDSSHSTTARSTVVDPRCPPRGRRSRTGRTASRPAGPRADRR
jgi:hypothetical protein